ncbi:MAG: dienelactone hydrolase family protein [Verrucomicrobiota bacterium]|jgi:putative phosphoribosyl transferase
MNEHEIPVEITADNATLEGNLTIPAGARAVVLFAHGSGSSRHSPRNQFVAEMLQQAGLGTLLMDLLTAEEEAIDLHTAHLRFDIALLAERLVAATDWLARNVSTQVFHLGYFGSSTGAGAALRAAAQRADLIGAVVSRGGRPDLAGDFLPQVKAPTLLIVGGRDLPVIDLNKAAQAEMVCKNRLEIVPGATHLFEEPNALAQVARLARDWFVTHLVTAAVPA